jgi:hypothetical protein
MAGYDLVNGGGRWGMHGCMNGTFRPCNVVPFHDLGGWRAQVGWVFINV